MARPNWILRILLMFGGACYAATGAYWIATGELLVLGVVYGSAFLIMAGLTPYLDRGAEEGPLCRACHRPVIDESFGFCLRCGIEEPLKVKARVA